MGYTLRTQRARRRALLGAMASPPWPHLRFVRLRSPREVARFLEDVARETQG